MILQFQPLTSTPFKKIKINKFSLLDATQTWYADNSRALDEFAIIETYFHSLTRQVRGRGYYPKLSKSVLILHPKNPMAGKAFGAHHGFEVCMGARYLVGYIGDDKTKHDCLRHSTLAWEQKFCTISKTTGKYPQESYAAVVRSIRPDSIFIQCVTWDMGDTFAEV